MRLVAGEALTLLESDLQLQMKPKEYRIHYLTTIGCVSFLIQKYLNIHGALFINDQHYSNLVMKFECQSFWTKKKKKKKNNHEEADGTNVHGQLASVLYLEGAI